MMLEDTDAERLRQSKAKVTKRGTGDVVLLLYNSTTSGVLRALGCSPGDQVDPRKGKRLHHKCRGFRRR